MPGRSHLCLCRANRSPRRCLWRWWGWKPIPWWPLHSRQFHHSREDFPRNSRRSVVPMSAAFQKRWHIETLQFRSPKMPNKIHNHLQIVAPLDWVNSRILLSWARLSETYLVDIVLPANINKLFFCVVVCADAFSSHLFCLLPTSLTAVSHLLPIANILDDRGSTHIMLVWSGMFIFPHHQNCLWLFECSGQGTNIQKGPLHPFLWRLLHAKIHYNILQHQSRGLCWIAFQEPDEPTTNYAAGLGFSLRWWHLCCANPCFQVVDWCWSTAVCWILGKMMDDTELPWFLWTPLRTSLRTGSLPCTKSASRICIRHCELESSSSWPRKLPASLQLLLLHRSWKTLSKIAGSCIPRSPWWSNGNQPSECKPLTRNSTQKWKMWFDNKVVQLHPRHPHTSWWRDRCHCEQPPVSAMPARQSWLRSQSFKPTCLGLNLRKCPAMTSNTVWLIVWLKVCPWHPWRLQWQNPDLRDVRLKPTGACAGHLGTDDLKCPGKPQSWHTLFGNLWKHCS